MKRKNVHFIATLAAFSLILASCSNLTEGEKSVNPQQAQVSSEKAYISVSIADATSDTAARTVAPSFAGDYTGFKKFILKGSKGDTLGENPDIECSFEWESAGESAYKKLSEASIPLPLATEAEAWIFELTGYLSGTDADTATVYTGIKKQNMATGANSLSFDLSRASAYKHSSNSTVGGIRFELTFNDVGEKSIVKKVEAALFAPDEETPVAETEKTFTVTEKVATIDYSNIPAGKYVLRMTFLSAENIAVGYMDEVAYVLEGVVSTLIHSASTVDVNATYAISYFDAIANDTPYSAWADGYTPPTSFSRLTPVTLPKTGDLADTGRVFCGWYKSYDSNAEKPLTERFTGLIKEIQKNGVVEDLNLHGFFINKREKPTMLGVKFTYDGEADDANLKVAHQLTATPYYNDGTEDKPFLGTIVSWTWYVGDENGWTEITDNTYIDTADEAAGTDDAPATSTIRLKPEYAEKQMKVVAKQKWKVTGPDSDGIYTALENTEAKETVTEKAVAKGTLKLLKGDDNPNYQQQLYYDGLIVRGTDKRDAIGVKVKEGALIDAFYTTWTYNDPEIWLQGYHVRSESGGMGGYPGTFTVPGYVTLEDSPDIWFNVKYPAPTAEDVLPALVSASLGAESRAATTWGKVRFASKSLNSSFECKIGDGSWKDISTAEFDPPSDGKISFRYKQTGNGTEGVYDGSNYGKVFASDPYEWTGDMSEYTGQKLILGSVTLPDSAVVGTTITATAHPDRDDPGEINFVAEGRGSITWNWYAGEEKVQTEENTHSATSSLRITEAIRAAHFAAGDKIRAEAVFTYAADETNATTTKDCSVSMAAGTLDASDGVYTYRYAEGQTSYQAPHEVSAANIQVSGLKNAFAEAVPAAGSVATDNISVSATLEETKSVEFKINIPGYSEITRSVTVKIRPVAPKINASSDILSTDVTLIPLGAILFAQKEGGIDPGRLEFCYDSDYTEGRRDNEYWHALPTDRPVFKDSYDATWDNAVAFAVDDIIWVRYKATGSTNASDPTKVTIATETIGTHQAAGIEITIVAEGDLKLSVNEGVITATALDGSTNACIWYIDDVEIENYTANTLSLSSDVWSGKVSGIYAVRVESTNRFGETISANATVSK